MSSTTSAPIFKKRGGKRKQMAQRASALLDAEDAPVDAGVVRPERSKAGGVTHKRARAPAAREPEPKAAPVEAVTSSAAADAVRQNALEETPLEKRAREAREAALAAEVAAVGPAGDGLYRGQAGYTQWVPDGDKDRPKAARRGPKSGIFEF